jgi:hypothetical protein
LVSTWFWPANASSSRKSRTTSKIPYNGQAGDIKWTQWQPWNIDLASTGASLTSVTKLVIGAWLNGASVGRGFTGKIDDARFYNPTLSQEDLAGRTDRTVCETVLTGWTKDPMMYEFEALALWRGPRRLYCHL